MKTKNALGKLSTETITVKNFAERIKDIDLEKFPPKLKEATPLVEMTIEDYDTDPDMKMAIDKYLKQLNEFLAKKRDTKKADKKADKKTVTKKISSTAKKEKPATSTGKKTYEEVAKVSPEVRFIKRYVLMDGKRKTRKQLLTFINSLQRAIERKEIRKTSKYAKEIMHIQNELIKIHNDPDVGDTFTFRLDGSDKKVLEKYREIAGSQRQRTSVRLISRYIGIHGKTNVKEKAERLLKAIKNAFSKKQIDKTDPYYSELKKVQDNLTDYIKAKETRLTINKVDLKGLQGIAGIAGTTATKKKNKLGLIEYNHDIKPGDKVLTPLNEQVTIEKVKNGLAWAREFPGRALKVRYLYKISEINRKHKQNEKHPVSLGAISAKQFAEYDYDTYGFDGKWLNLIGDPAKPFHLMFWSKPGLGKSTLAIELAKYLATQFNQKVLFAAIEEGLSYTLKDKFRRLNAFDDSIFILPELPEKLDDYDVIIIDSVTRMKMQPDDFVKLKNKYPQKTFILIFQSTVDGNYRGNKEWEHEVDVSIYINENGYASAQKTRFGGAGTIKVFKGKTDPIYKFTLLQDAEKFVANRKDEKLRMLQGDDGKIWVTNQDKANELQKAGYQLY